MPTKKMAFVKPVVNLHAIVKHKAKITVYIANRKSHQLVDPLTKKELHIQ